MQSAAKLILVAGCLLLVPGLRTRAGAGHETSPPAPAPAGEARAVAAVEVPALAFSDAPTQQELFRARVFQEPLVPVGGEPTADENRALAAALLGYAHRKGPDDFSSLTAFLERHGDSVWAPALLTDLGLEYYNTAHYSLALAAWQKAWARAKDAAGREGKAVGDRAAGELASMYARLGRMTELEALLKSVEGRVFVGPATERIGAAREGLWEMQHRPEVSFRCGPLALQRIKLAVDPQHPGSGVLQDAASTQQGFSLTRLARLSREAGMNYQMAFRQPGAAWVVPSVVHWTVGHYAALVRQQGDRYLLQDPTFRNDVWATRQALESETSGYFLLPAGSLAKGWRAVTAQEGDTVWGKGNVGGNDDGPKGPCDKQSGGGSTCDDPCASSPGPPYFDQRSPYYHANRMAVSSVHLSTVNLNLRDEPVGYSPPVGPPVGFGVRYNHRDAFQPTTFTYANFGPKWTCDWVSYITDNPQNPLQDVTYYIRGGGQRTFTGFSTNTQSFASQQYDQTLLTRTGPASYTMLWLDGSQLVFSQSDGSVGTSRKVFLTQVIDPFGNTVTLNYDGSLRLVGITDAIGQVTTVSYGNPSDIYKITKVTDPFGRFATFGYDSLGRLTNITDVIGINSQFAYLTSGDFISNLITPYGTNSFTAGGSGTTRFVETVYPDGSRDRVEFNQTITAIPMTDPPATVPQGMATHNNYLQYRNTYYWSRAACASSYGDYTKAKIFHWLHTADGTSASGILESIKEPLENRVWFDYAGQPGDSIFVGTSNQPQHAGRVLDDGSTQLYTYAYDGFGHLTNSIDPVGRTFSYVYASNGIDALEVRMTRAGQNQLLLRATYNTQHRPLTMTDAAGQTNSASYNARGQVLTQTDAKNEVTTFNYDPNGYLLSVDGPLPGTNDTVSATYDGFGRIRTETDASGYTLSVDYDVLDRVARLTHPDGTFEQFSYDRLDPAIITDRAGRQTLLQHDAMRQLVRRTDPLGRVTSLQWCSCGAIKSLTDPLGRTTAWVRDVQNRVTAKQYGDGSLLTCTYENTTSRIRQIVDEKLQSTSFSHNRDDTLNSLAYANTQVPTPAVSYTYDPDYLRVSSMTDGTGTTVYQYVPVTAPPALGAGQLASVTGPLPNSTITYGYDELGRPVAKAINGVGSLLTFDAAGRRLSETNVLGTFTYAYDGPSRRLLSESYPNGQTTSRAFLDNLGDRALQGITNRFGATLLSEFLYARNTAANRITTWSQQAGTALPNIYSMSYDSADQLLSTVVTNGGVLVNSYAYAYDSTANRLTEQVGSSTVTATYNALNQLNVTAGGAGATRTNQWDGANRLSAVNSGPQRTEFTYDGLDRLVAIRLLTNGTQASLRQFVWAGNELAEERDGSGAVTKRFFNRGVQLASGPNAGAYFYTRDHLGSVRELADSSGTVRARYSYDPFGRRTHVAGDLDADFGFAGMFWSSEAALALTHYRAYDPELGRWLSRDPLDNAEQSQGPNLYAYVRNNPANAVDPTGLCCEDKLNLLLSLIQHLLDDCAHDQFAAAQQCAAIHRYPGSFNFCGKDPKGNWKPASACDSCAEAQKAATESCGNEAAALGPQVQLDSDLYLQCLLTECGAPKTCKQPKVSCHKVLAFPSGATASSLSALLPRIETHCTVEP